MLRMLRKHPAEIEFITPVAAVGEMFPPVPAGRMMPGWMRDMPAYTERRRFPKFRTRAEVTMKGCPGVGDYMGLGWIVPLWADYIFSATSDGFHWESAVPKEKDNVLTFEPELIPSFPRQENEHSYVLKLGTPWMVRTPPGWSIIICAPWYHREKRFIVLPGVMESDRCHVVNMVALWNAPEGEPVLLKAGTPLLHIIPVKRSKLDLKVVVDSETNWPMIGRGIDAAYGARIATGGYRENGRKVHAQSTK